MAVFYYNFKSEKLWDGWIVLWDGQSTYWCDEMRPSPDYNVRPDKRKSKGGYFYYIGEL